VISEES